MLIRAKPKTQARLEKEAEAAQHWLLMQRISLSRDNVRVLKRAAHAELSMRLLGTARRHILDIADGPQHERAGEWIAAVAEVKHTSGLPPKLASMDECSLRSRKGALCPTHKYLPIPRCYFHSDASELAAAAEQEEEDEEGEEEEDEVGDVEEVDDGDRDPTEMLWEYSINAWLGENYSMASAYPDQLYLSVVPTTNHESPWSIVLGMRTYMPPGTTQTTLDDPPEEFNSPKQVHEVYKRTRRGLDRSTEWRLLFSRHNIKALHYQRLREEIPEWLEVTDNIEPMLQKATVYECGNEHFDGAVAGLLVLEVHGPPDIEHKQATHGTGMFEPTVDFTDGAVRRARRYFVVAPAPALEMFVAALHKDDVVGWHGVRDVLQKGIEGDLPGVSEATSDHGHTSTQRSSWAHEYWPPVYNDTAAARIAKLDEGNFDAFVQTHELSVIFFYSSSSREFDRNGAPSGLRTGGTLSMILTGACSSLHPCSCLKYRLPRSIAWMWTRTVCSQRQSASAASRRILARSSSTSTRLPCSRVRPAACALRRRRVCAGAIIPRNPCQTGGSRAAA